MVILLYILKIFVSKLLLRNTVKSSQVKPKKRIHFKKSRSLQTEHPSVTLEATSMRLKLSLKVRAEAGSGSEVTCWSTV